MYLGGLKVGEVVGADKSLRDLIDLKSGKERREETGERRGREGGWCRR